MAAQGIVINVKGTKQLTSKISKLVRRLENPAPLHKLWGASIFRWVIRNFEQQGQLAEPGGWALLKPSTLARRRRGPRRNRGPQILQDTGTLRKSFTFKSDIRNATIGNVKIGSQTGYAVDHQFGVPGRNLPARPILPPEFKLIKNDINSIALKYIKAQRQATR